MGEVQITIFLIVDMSKQGTCDD